MKRQVDDGLNVRKQLSEAKSQLNNVTKELSIAREAAGERSREQARIERRQQAAAESGEVTTVISCYSVLLLVLLFN